MPLPTLNSDDDYSASDGIVYLTQALREPLPAGQDILVVAIPTSVEAPEKFLRVAPRDHGYLWKSPRSMQLAGSGVVASVTGSGPYRFADLRDGARALWKRLCVRYPGETPVQPTLVGGVAFVADPPEVAPWEEFRVDTFTLARWGYRRYHDAAHLVVSIRREELEQPDVVAGIVAETRRILAALEKESATTIIQRPEITAKSVHHMSPAEWTAYIELVQSTIASGAFDKIVAARRCVVDLPAPLDETAYMARLFAAYADCTHFALTRPNATFLGATPETLFRRRNNDVMTHALAGTVRVTNNVYDEPPSSTVAALQKSAKNLVEHDYVVKKIIQDLSSISTRVSYATTPETRRVRDLLHLQTPISCELREGVDVFQIVDMLHPTPAVSGCPAKPAANWLRDNEPIERGLYTGAVGWLDADGNADFAVAIRCGVLTEERVHIYAGAGIVKDSDPEAEYLETGAKMNPLLRALGVTL